MAIFGEILISALLVLGGVFGLVGSWGLARLPDPMTRLHGPTKAVTLGVGGVLLASLLWFACFGAAASWHELLITLFLFLTAPVTGLMISKVNMHLRWREGDLPRPPGGNRWATCADPAAPRLMDDDRAGDSTGREHRE